MAQLLYPNNQNLVYFSLRVCLKYIIIDLDKTIQAIKPNDHHIHR